MPSPRRSAVNPPGVPAPVRAYYSNAIRVEAGPLLFVAGQIPIDESGALVGEGDAAAQTEQVFRNIAAIVEGAGGRMEDIVKVLVFITDMDEMPKVSAVRERLFPKDGPASSIVEISRLIDHRMIVEIEAVVALPEDRP